MRTLGRHMHYQPWISASLSDAQHLQCLLCSPGVHMPHSWCLLSDSEEVRTYHMPGKKSKSTITIRWHIWHVHPPPHTKATACCQKLLRLTITEEAKHIHWVDYILPRLCLFVMLQKCKMAQSVMFWALLTKSLQPFYVGITAWCHRFNLQLNSAPMWRLRPPHWAGRRFYARRSRKRIWVRVRVKVSSMLDGIR